MTEIDSPVNPHINICPDCSVLVHILCDQSFIKIAVTYGRFVLTEFEYIESTADVFQSEQLYCPPIFGDCQRRTFCVTPNIEFA